MPKELSTMGSDARTQQLSWSNVMRQQHTTFALCLTLVALVLTAGGARAQQVSTYERAKAGMTVQAARDFDRVIADARARGLPVEPLIDKALEGQAKRVPPER